MKEFWIFLSYFGDIAYWLGFTISFFLIYPFLDKKSKEKVEWIPKLLIPGIIGVYCVIFLLKEFFRVPRICPDCPPTYAFPSGHAAIGFAFATLLSLYFKNFKIFLLTFSLAFLISISRLALFFHLPIDVIVGGLIGILFGLFTYFFYKKIFIEKSLNPFLVRKFIHLSGLIFVFSYFFISRELLIFALTSMALLYIVSEFLRTKKKYLPFFHDITAYCATSKELKFFVSPPLLFILALILLLFLNQRMFLFGSVSLIIGDCFAGLAGKFFGKRKIFYNEKKTWEGFFSCLFSTFIPFALLSNPLTGFFLSILTAAIESFLSKWENFILPVSIGFLSYFLV